jgi:di/tricarboxylate transporter
MNQVVAPIIKIAGKSENKIIALVSGTVGLISSMIQNIGAAALFLPATQRISKRLEIPVSRILIPMGFCAIIGGTITLVGASPTILLNDLMVLGGEKLKPFGLFTQTPIGICLLASAIIYFLLFGRFVLPAASGEADKGVEYRWLESTYELHIPADFNGPRTLQELGIRPKFLVTVVAISLSRRKEKNFLPRSSDEISANDDIAVVGRDLNIHKLADEYGWQIKDGLDVFSESLSRTNAGIAETIVSPRSELIGKSMSEIKFKELYGVNPVLLYKEERLYSGGGNHAAPESCFRRYVAGDCAGTNYIF